MNAFSRRTVPIFLPLIAGICYALMFIRLQNYNYLAPLAGIVAVAVIAVVYRAAVLDPRMLLGTFVFVFIATSIFFRTREVGVAGLDPQNGFKAVMWAVLILICGVNWRRTTVLWSDLVLLSYVCIIGFYLFSASYSMVPTYTAISAIGLLVYLAISCLAVIELAERQVLLAMIWGLLGYTLLCWIVAAVMPDVGYLPPYGNGTLYRLQGISGHPNTLGQQMVALACLALVAHFRGHLRRSLFWLVMLIALVTMLATDSRTSAISLAIAWGLTALRRHHALRHFALYLGLAVAILIMLSSLYQVTSLLSAFSRDPGSSELATLTGRTELWSFVWEKILQKPLLGWGFNSFEATVVYEWYGWADAGVATHNNYLEQLYGVGIVGTIPFLALLFILGRRLLFQPEPGRDIAFLYLLITGLTEVTSPSVTIIPSVSWFVILAIDARNRRQALSTSTLPVYALA